MKGEGPGAAPYLTLSLPLLLSLSLPHLTVSVCRVGVRLATYLQEREEVLAQAAALMNNWRGGVALL